MRSTREHDHAIAHRIRPVSLSLHLHSGTRQSMNLSEKRWPLRRYLLAGGFLVVDDLGHVQWLNFEEQIHRVLPA